MQSLVTDFGGDPTTGTSKDGRQRSFDVLMGTNFADGNGNITGYLSYRHADPVRQQPAGLWRLPIQSRTTDPATNNVTGVTCGGSIELQLVRTADRPQREHYLQRSWDGSHPDRVWMATTPPATFNSQPYIYMTREDDRYNAAVLGT